MDSSSDIYRLSGKPGAALIGAPLVAVIVGSLLGFAYAYADEKNKWIRAAETKALIWASRKKQNYTIT